MKMMRNVNDRLMLILVFNKKLKTFEKNGHNMACSSKIMVKWWNNCKWIHVHHSYRPP